MKIEAGKFYRTRDGRKVGPMFEYTWFDKSDDVAFIETEGDGHYWSVDGKYCKGSSSDHDLIAELADEPETSTLAELNVKPGDVVEWLERPEFGKMSVTKVDIVDSGLYSGQLIVTLSEYGTGVFGSCEVFRIISRASQSTTPPTDVTTPLTPTSLTPTPPDTGLTPTPLTHSTTPTRTITTNGTWQANGPKPKTQYVYSLTFDLDTEGHPIWSSAKVTGR